MKRVCIVAMAAVMVISAICVSCNSTSLAGITASLPDITEKPDGVYRGLYDLSGTPLKVVVDVTVHNHTIAAVHILSHSCSPIGKKAEKITGTVVAQQSLAVDVVSGATGSSMTILKAIENALQ